MADLPPIVFKHKKVEPLEPPDSVMRLVFHNRGTAINQEAAWRLFGEQIAAEEHLFSSYISGGILDSHALDAMALWDELPDGQTKTPVERTRTWLWRRHNALRRAPNVAEAIKERLTAFPKEKMIVIIRHQETMQYMRGALSDFGHASFYANETPERREQDPMTIRNIRQQALFRRTKMVQRFVDRPNCRVLIAPAKAITGAWDLTVARWLVFAEPSWHRQTNEMAVRRIWRASQKRPCKVWFYSIARSPEWKFINAHKLALQRALLPDSVSFE